jgi:chromosomal replication initiation ATPase DnaA
MEGGYRVPVTESDRIRVGLAVQLVSVATGVPAERMRRPARLDGAAGRARRLAMYVAHVTLGWPLERVGHGFGLNRATAARACRWVEDSRDQPALDAMLDRLDRSVREVLDAPQYELPA